MTMIDQPRPAKPRPRLRTLEVRRVERTSPRLVTVTLGGSDLEGFEAPGPGRHVKVFVPPADPGDQVLPVAGPEGPIFPSDVPRPATRTYTPRRWNEAALELDIDIVVHETGMGSDWARRAAVGDTVVIAGPGGRFRLDPNAGRYLLAADHAGLPALGSILEALPESARVTAFCEVPEASDECALPSRASVDLTWLHSAGHEETPDELLVQAVRSAALGDLSSGRVWIGCESVAMHTLRAYLVRDLGLSTAHIHTQGYWKVGVANHPDHDYGDDD